MLIAVIILFLTQMTQITQIYLAGWGRGIWKR